MKNIGLVIFAILLFTSNCFAQYSFDFSPDCRQAYNEIMQLQISKGYRYIESAQ
jgi:hypothetical protein